MKRIYEGTVAYNPNTEQEIHFKSKRDLAFYFGILPNTITYWFRNGRPILDLMSADKERGMFQKAEQVQAKLKGFEIYTDTEWKEMA